MTAAQFLTATCVLMSECGLPVVIIGLPVSAGLRTSVGLGLACSFADFVTQKAAA